MGKSLQKFAELTSPDKVNQFLDANPEEVDGLIYHLIKRAWKLEDYEGEKLDEYKLRILTETAIIHKEGLEKQDGLLEYFRNQTYQNNHDRISSFMHNYIVNNRKLPTQTKIADELGLSRVTVSQHLKDGLNNKYNSFMNDNLKFMKYNALQRLYFIGVDESNPSALKTFIELTGGVNNNITNNYIQINNIKLSKEDFESLPQEKILEIEAIVKDCVKPNQTI